MVVGVHEPRQDGPPVRRRPAARRAVPQRARRVAADRHDPFAGDRDAAGERRFSGPRREHATVEQDESGASRHLRIDARPHSERIVCALRADYDASVRWRSSPGWPRSGRRGGSSMRRWTTCRRVPRDHRDRREVVREEVARHRLGRHRRAGRIGPGQRACGECRRAAAPRTLPPATRHARRA